MAPKKIAGSQGMRRGPVSASPACPGTPYNASMPHFPDHPTLEIVLYAAAGLIVLFLGYRFGRLMGSLSSQRQMAQKERDLFTAQRGFKQLYEQELETVRAANVKHEQEVATLNKRVEEYRRKAAGYGGLFNSGNKRSDAMYALLLENEALEETLYAQNDKMRQDRTDSLKEQLRATGYRRVLMSQLLNDDRIKTYVQEIMNEEKHLPAPGANHAASAPRPAAAATPAAPVDGEEVSR